MRSHFSNSSQFSHKTERFNYFVELDAQGGAVSVEIDPDLGCILGSNALEICQQLGWVCRIANHEHVEVFLNHRQQLASGKVSLSLYKVINSKGLSDWVVDAARPLWAEGEGVVGAIEGSLFRLASRPGLLNEIKQLLQMD